MLAVVIKRTTSSDWTFVRICNVKKSKNDDMLKWSGGKIKGRLGIESILNTYGKITIFCMVNFVTGIIESINDSRDINNFIVNFYIRMSVL